MRTGEMTKKKKVYIHSTIENEDMDISDIQIKIIYGLCTSFTLHI